MKKKTWIWIIAAVAVVIIIAVAAGGNNSSTTTNEETENSEVVEKVSAKAEKLRQDSIQLLKHLDEKTEGGLVNKCYEITEFSDKTCRLRVTIPEEVGRSNANVIGKGVCILASQFLAENGYKIDDPFSYTVFCYVYSPYVGVTKREGMVTQWGRASYDPGTDSVDWKWSK